MFRAIGRFLKKVKNNFKKAAKIFLGKKSKKAKKSKQSKNPTENTYETFEEPEEVVEHKEEKASGFLARKFVSVMVAASGVFFLTYPSGPATPLTMATGGRLLTTASTLWNEE